MASETVIRSWLPSAGRPDLTQELLETAVAAHFMFVAVGTERFYVLAERAEPAELLRFLAPPHAQLEDLDCWRFPTHKEAERMYKHLTLFGEDSGSGCWIVEYVLEESMLIAAQ